MPTTRARERLVHPVVERKCGSIDCRQLPRVLRVYRQNGLRLPNASARTPGEAATTVDEARATYLSILSLEPERTNAFLLSTRRTPEGAHDLTFLCKALERERHGGGASLAKGEPAEQCACGGSSERPLRTVCAAATR